MKQESLVIFPPPVFPLSRDRCELNKEIRDESIGVHRLQLPEFHRQPACLLEAILRELSPLNIAEKNYLYYRQVY